MFTAPYGLSLYLIRINLSRLLSLHLPEGRAGTAWNLQGSKVSVCHLR